MKISKFEKELHGNHGAMVNGYEPKVKPSKSDLPLIIMSAIVFFGCIALITAPVRIAENIGKWGGF